MQVQSRNQIFVHNPQPYTEREIFNDAYDFVSGGIKASGINVFQLVNNATFTSTSYLIESATNSVSVAIVITAIGTSVAVSVYGVDAFGNVMNGTALASSTVSAAGNSTLAVSTGGYRRLAVVVAATGTNTGSLSVQG